MAEHAIPNPAVNAPAAAAVGIDPQQVMHFFHQLHQQTQVQQQALMNLLQQAQQQAAPMTAQQMLALSALGSLPRFAGRADATGMAAREWMQQAEHHFAARESALGVVAGQGDAYRVHSARAALTEDGLRWFMALPAPPMTWLDFKTQFLGRFSSVPAAQVREQQLRQFVHTAQRLRDKLNVEGLQRFTTLFLQRAGEIPLERMTDATKRQLYAQGLPSRYAELVLTEDAKDQPPALHEVAQRVLSKATFKAYAGSDDSQGSAARNYSRDRDAMDVDAIALCAVQFGVSREEAAAYMEGPDDYEVDSRGGSGQRSTPPASGTGDELLGKLLAALSSASGMRHGGRPHSFGGKGKPGRGGAGSEGSGALKDVSEDLIAARKDAGLCVRCGVVKYERGSKGHNARTCKAPVDKNTSAAEGKRLAVAKGNF